MRTTTRSRPALATFVLSVLALAVLAPTARSQATALWTNGTSATANWNDPANWFNGINGFGQAGALVSFNNTDLSGPQTVVLNGTYTLGTFSVGDNAGTRYPYTFSGGILVFNRSGIAAAYNQGANTGPTYLNSAVQLVDDLTLTIHNNASLTLAGSITGNRALTKAELGTLILTGAVNESTNVTLTRGTLQLGDGGTSGTLGSGTVTMSNSAVLRFNRSDNVSVSNTLAGVGIVEQAGTGILSLTGSNTFSAGVRLTAGTLEVGSTGAIGNFGTITFNGGTLRYSAANTTDYSARFSNAASQLYRVDTNGQAVTLASALTSSDGTLTKLGSGTLTLSGTNTYSGGTTLSAGTLRAAATDAFSPNSSHTSTAGTTLDLNNFNQTIAGLSGDGSVTLGTASLSVNQSANTTFAGSISGSGSLTKLGTGTLTLSGANSYSGGTTLSAGTLALGSAGAIGSTGTITFNGGTLQFSAANTTDYSARFSTADNQLYRVDTNGQNVTLASDLSSYEGSLAKLGSGTLTLTGTNSYHLSTTIAAGTLQIGNGGTSGTLGEGHVTNLGSLVFHRSDDLTVTNNISGSGSITKLGAGKLTLAAANTYTGTTTVSAGTLQIGDGDLSGTLVSNIVNEGAVIFRPSGDSTYSGSISGSGSLTLTGDGMLTLAGANTFTGPTTIQAGGLALGHALALQNSTLTRGDSEFSFGILTAATLGGLAGTGSLVLENTVPDPLAVEGSSNTPVALTVGGNHASTTYSGDISGAGSLIKIGDGTLTLTGNNTYYGGNTISDGTLKIANSSGSALGSGDVTVASGATLTGAGSFTGSLQLAGTVAPGNSPGTLSAGNTTFAGGGTYLWEINHATGVSGTNWDLLSISGALNITATSGSRFTINLTSLLADNSPGNVINFNPATNYSYTIATASDGISGFSSDAFTLNTTNFSNALNGGTWSLAANGNNLNLNFTASAIPEPSTYAAIFGAVALAFAVYRRRQKK